MAGVRSLTWIDEYYCDGLNANPRAYSFLTLAYLDTSWFLANVNSVDKKIVNVNHGTYDALSINSMDTCLPHGDYNFTVYDEYGKEQSFFPL
jgi:hypothetical protein